MHTVYVNGQELNHIYEYGDSIIDCKTNFVNLFNNWTETNISNAKEYRMISYALVETIEDSVRYNYYRNYFSGSKVLMSSKSRSTKTGYDGVHYFEYNIRPGYNYAHFFDSTVVNDQQNSLLNEELKLEARNILLKDYNIDQIKLYTYIAESSKIDTVFSNGRGSKILSTSNSKASHYAVSANPISKNYIDVIVKHTKAFEKLNMDEKRQLCLEQIVIERLQRQLYFNENVLIGDKVYGVKFEYKSQLYTNYVICSFKTNRVVMDYFFASL